MRDAPVCWSEGYGALVVLSKCKFLSRILTFKHVLLILNSLTGTKLLKLIQETGTTVTQKAQGLYRNRKEKISVLCTSQDFAGYSKGHMWKCQKEERYLFSFLTLLILIIFMVLESGSVHQ